MSFLDGLLRLAKPYSEDDDDGIEDIMNRSSKDKLSSDTISGEPRNGGKLINLHTTTQLQVMLMKPEKFESAAEVADHLRQKHTVVLNLEKTKYEESRRLIDFLSGVAYALDGKVKKVANSTYIITPYNVNILGDLLDELESNGMYFN